MKKWLSILKFITITNDIVWGERGVRIPPPLDLHINFVCFVALHPKSTAMVMAGRSVHLAILFPGQA